MDKRLIVQILSSIFFNGNIKGFISGKIYKGPLKNLCVPGLNCYSCPGALGSCPIGSLQAVIGSIKYSFSFYVTGFILLMGIMFGRLICGWMCPFGLIQDLLNKIPSPKIKIVKGENIFRNFKYIILLVFVIVLPILLSDEFGMSDPYFCKYICPAGTLEGGVPLVLFNKSLRASLGILFVWKFLLLILIIFLSIVIYRPFCRFVCPLGAIYSLMNPISFYKQTIIENKCTSCGTCSRVCKINIQVDKTPNSPECIRCGRCKDVCPAKAIKSSFFE